MPSTLHRHGLPGRHRRVPDTRITPAPRRRPGGHRLAPGLLARTGVPPRELFTARYWADLVAEAEHGLLDFVTLEDGLGPQTSRFLEPDDRTDQVRGRLDAVLTAARIAP